MQPKHFPKNIKNDCCLLITDDVDTKLQQETGLNFPYVGSSRESGPDVQKTGTLALKKNNFFEAEAQASPLPPNCASWTCQQPP